jgi:hypothetical protein
MQLIGKLRNGLIALLNSGLDHSEIINSSVSACKAERIQNWSTLSMEPELLDAPL